MNKKQIIDDLIKREGGYVNNPNDKGGPTNWGITQTVARAHGFTDNMKTLTREQAVSIYELDYWFGPKLDQIAVFSEKLAEELLDTGVNMGPSTQIKWLQRWLNAFNLKGTLYPDMLVDGIVGPRLLTALDIYLKKRGTEGEAALIKAINCSQAVRYLELAEASSNNETFIYGWLVNRVQ